MAKPHALVTGACGFVGGYMCRILKKKGYRVTGVDLPSAQKPAVLKIVDQFCEADLTKPETLKAPLQGVDVVFHPAAIFSYSASRELLWKVNVDGTRNLCLAMLENKVKRLVNWSTAGVYGYQNPKYHPYREEAPKHPSNLYEVSKLEQEKVVASFLKSGLVATTIRPAPIYGPENVYGVAQILLGLARPPVLFVPRNFDFKMPFVHVVDVVRAASFLAEEEKAKNGTYNVVDNSSHTVFEFVHFLGRKLGKRVVVLPPMNPMRLRKMGESLAPLTRVLSKFIKAVPVLEKESLVYVGQSFWFSNEKLTQLGFQFKYPDVFQGLDRTLHWYKRNKML